jgi:hypothetical protein
MDLAFFREKDLQKTSPLLNNPQAWEGFLALLDYMQAKVLRELNTRANHETLLRLAAQFEQIQRLRNARIWIAEIEKGLKDASN